MNKEDMNKDTTGRRNFLISLGAGTALTITGFFAFNLPQTTASDNPEAAPDKPRLSGTTKKGRENGQLVLRGKNGKCLVNKTGERVIALLDGKNTLPDIAAGISGYYAIKHTDELEVAVASFLCQLGAQGFLSSPYYVIVCENC